MQLTIKVLVAKNFELDAFGLLLIGGSPVGKGVVR